MWLSVLFIVTIFNFLESVSTNGADCVVLQYLNKFNTDTCQIKVLTILACFYYTPVFLNENCKAVFAKVDATKTNALSGDKVPFQFADNFQYAKPMVFPPNTNT